MRGIDKTKSDYKTLVTLAALFAREGKTVKILANCHHKSEEYKIVLFFNDGVFIKNYGEK